MLGRVGLFLAIASAALAGCVSTTDGPALSVPEAVSDLLRPSEQPLWINPQTTPHPAFGFPTMTHPAVGSDVPAWWQPIAAAELPATITGMEHLAGTAGEVEAGAGFAIFGSLLVLPGFSEATHVIDISDPAAPKVLSTIEENHRNVDLIAYPTGRLVAVFSTGRAGILPIWDLTDPANPARLGEMKPTTGTHKVNVVPGTPIVYNANSHGGGSGPFDIIPTGHVQTTAAGVTEIFDLSDPDNPVHVQDWKNGYGCHHIYFWNDPAQEKYRAICAGIEVTQIWDIADPLNPKVIVTIPVHHGVAGTPSGSIPIFAFSHFSILNDDGTVLIVGDEMGGGGIPPGCAARTGTPVRDVTTPAGALWFYDVKDEKNPKLLGWFSPGAPYATNPPKSPFFSCTAHHGRLVPNNENRDLLAMAFYYAGVVLVDFTDPMSPKQIDQFADGTDTWEAWYYNGYIFTGDLARGMDVLTLK